MSCERTGWFYDNGNEKLSLTRQEKFGTDMTALNEGFFLPATTGYLYGWYHASRSPLETFGIASVFSRENGYGYGFGCTSLCVMWSRGWNCLDGRFQLVHRLFHELLFRSWKEDFAFVHEYASIHFNYWAIGFVQSGVDLRNPDFSISSQPLGHVDCLRFDGLTAALRFIVLSATAASR